MDSKKKKEIKYFLKKVVSQPSELDTAKCNGFLQRVKEIMEKTK